MFYLYIRIRYLLRKREPRLSILSFDRVFSQRSPYYSDRTGIEVGRSQSLPSFLDILAPILNAMIVPSRGGVFSAPDELTRLSVCILTSGGPPRPHRIRGRSRFVINTRLLRNTRPTINTHHITRTGRGLAIMACHKYRLDAHRNHLRATYQLSVSIHRHTRASPKTSLSRSNNGTRNHKTYTWKGNSLYLL